MDSHSRSANGLLHPDGTSVVLKFVCLDDLHDYICCLANTLTSGVKLFELCGIRISAGADLGKISKDFDVCQLYSDIGFLNVVAGENLVFQPSSGSFGGR